MRMTGCKMLIAVAGLALAGSGVPAAAAAAAAKPAVAAAPAAAEQAASAAPATPAPVQAAPAEASPVAGLGMPAQDGIGIQPQVTANGRQAQWFHDVILLPLISLVSLFVLALLAWVIFRYRAAANATPSKTSHNTTIEVIWTLAPVAILVAIAIPSIRLLAAQFKPAPANAVTLKAIGNQWYWSYEYPDHGGVQLTANMLKEQAEVGKGERFRTDADGPRLLATDNRVVLPVGVPIRLQTTGADVIHSWAMPAFWIKLDAVPGRLNETSFTIEKPGVYYGQCSELCGSRHGYMPISVEAVPPAQFAAWIAAKGGTMPGAAPAAAAPAAAAAGGAPAAAETADANATQPAPAPATAAVGN